MWRLKIRKLNPASHSLGERTDSVSLLLTRQIIHPQVEDTSITGSESMPNAIAQRQRPRGWPAVHAWWLLCVRHEAGGLALHHPI